MTAQILRMYDTTLHKDQTAENTRNRTKHENPRSQKVNMINRMETNLIIILKYNKK